MSSAAVVGASVAGWGRGLPKMEFLILPIRKTSTRRCGCEGSPRDTVTRRSAYEPLGWRPTTLVVTIRRYRCSGCGHL